jgi:hypothetical protein
MKIPPMFMDCRINAVIAILSKAIYAFNAIPIKSPMPLFIFHRNRKVKPKIHLKEQKILNSESNPV